MVFPRLLVSFVLEMIIAKNGAELCKPLLLNCTRAGRLNVKGQRLFTCIWGKVDERFILCYVFECLFLGSNPGQESSRIPRSSLIMAKARWYLSSSERGGGVMAPGARTAGTPGANGKVASISQENSLERYWKWWVMLTGR